MHEPSQSPANILSTEESNFISELRHLGTESRAAVSIFIHVMAKETRIPREISGISPSRSSSTVLRLGPGKSVSCTSSWQPGR